MLRLVFFVKFEGRPPEMYSYAHFEEMWHDIRERMMRGNFRLEWMIRE